MTTGDYRKDAQSDVRDLSKPRPNDPPPTTAGAGGCGAVGGGVVPSPSTRGNMTMREFRQLCRQILKA
jgi:hypothetical protein